MGHSDFLIQCRVRVCLTAVDSLEARVISRFPLRPSRAGTRMKISVMY